MTHITNPNHEHILHRLESDRIELETQLNEHTILSNLRDATGELSTIDHHPADVGTELFERSKDLALHDARRLQLEQIEWAIQRLQAGRYGCCDVCEGPIEPERLGALPHTTTCSIHAPRDIDRQRPIEEEVIQENHAERRRYAEVYGIDTHAFVSAADDVHDLIIENIDKHGIVRRTQQTAIWASDLHGNPIEAPVQKETASKSLAFELDLDDFDEFSNVISDDR